MRTVRTDYKQNDDSGCRTPPEDECFQKLYGSDSSERQCAKALIGQESTPEEHVYPTYGIILDQGIDKFVNDVKPTGSDVFYDLGSGNGNVCVRVYNTTPVKKCVGIECDQQRYKASVPLAQQTKHRKMIFVKGNFIHHNISDATIVFMDSIMFTDDTLMYIETNLLSTCQNLRYVISMKKLPESTQLQYIKEVAIPTSWGQSQYHLYNRIVQSI
jgi:hypothetical protein